MNFASDMLKSVVIVLLTSECCYSALSWSINDSGCLTPDGGTGDCLPVADCQYMKEALLTVKRPLSAAAQKQLNEYLCSTDGVYQVCCPSKPIIINDQIVVKIDVPDITTHRNYDLLPTDCGFVDIAVTKVINGMDAGFREFPWMSRLSFRESDNRGRFKCGGTMINERYILTAAHCLEERTKLLGVRVGEYDDSKKIDCFNDMCNDPVQDLAIEEVITHPNYNKTGLLNDIGLLRVTPIKFNDNNIRPICLPRENFKTSSDNLVELTGWGLTQAFSSRSSSNVLQLAYLQVVNQTACKEIYKIDPNVIIDERTICAGGGTNNSQACLGDSGGPIQVKEKIDNIFRYVQHGVVSLGPMTCDSATKFTRVFYYMDWILDNMKP